MAHLFEASDYQRASGPQATVTCSPAVPCDWRPGPARQRSIPADGYEYSIRPDGLGMHASVVETVPEGPNVRHGPGPDQCTIYEGAAGINGAGPSGYRWVHVFAGWEAPPKGSSLYRKVRLPRFA